MVGLTLKGLSQLQLVGGAVAGSAVARGFSNIIPGAAASLKPPTGGGGGPRRSSSINLAAASSAQQASSTGA